MFIRLFHAISYRSSNEIEPYHNKQGPMEEPFVGVLYIKGSLWPEECREVCGSDLLYTTMQSLTNTKLTEEMLEYNLMTHMHSLLITPIKVSRA